MKDVEKLIELLRLENTGENQFTGKSISVGSTNVFGGQVLAQALYAAGRTVPADRPAHSLHAYFILPGDLQVPISFQVECIRNGGSFTTRRVKVLQEGRAIFFMSASFQKVQNGFDHHMDMPDVPPPEKLDNWEELAGKYEKMLPENIKKFLNLERPIEFKPVELIDPALPVKSRPYRHIWMKAKGDMPGDRGMHQCVLAYTSDYNLLMTALLPHGDKAALGKVQMASLDHAMWFHRDFQMDDWLLYAIDSPSASNARGFTRGNIFSRDGRLIASVVQEGLIRPIEKF